MAERSEGAEALERALEEGAQNADPEEVAEADARLKDLLEKVDLDAADEAKAEATPAATKVAALPEVNTRTALATAIRGREVSLRVRGVGDPVIATLDVGVAREVVQAAIVNGDRVVVEQAPDEAPLVVGVVTTRVPEELTLKAKKILIEGEREVLVRSGRGAMRIRQDGDVELVGSRISAMSRGLFRLVGRVLRLN